MAARSCRGSPCRNVAFEQNVHQSKTGRDLCSFPDRFSTLFFNRDVDEFSLSLSSPRNLFDLPRLIYVPRKKLSSSSFRNWASLFLSFRPNARDDISIARLRSSVIQYSDPPSTPRSKGASRYDVRTGGIMEKRTWKGRSSEFYTSNQLQM